MSTYSPTTYPAIKMGFRERWQAKFVFSAYPVQVAGFTLIELSIVLVIIGLIVGGVLVGQDLIKAAEIRAQISDVEKLNTTVNTFRLKYNCLPGDCKNATTFFSAGSQPEQVANGNGDKKICGARASAITNCDGVDNYGRWYLHETAVASEWFRVFDHLAAAGLWDMAQYNETDLANSFVPGVGIPKLTINSKGQGASAPTQNYIQGGWAVGYHPAFQYVKAGHKIRFGLCQHATFPINDKASFHCGLNPDEAFAIDSKIDDGKPYTGTVFLMGDATYSHYIPGGVSDGTVWCGIFAQNKYRSESEIVNNYLRHCALTINAAF